MVEPESTSDFSAVKLHQMCSDQDRHEQDDKRLNKESKHYRNRLKLPNLSDIVDFSLAVLDRP